MGFFMVVMSITLLFLCYFSVKVYNRILELESSRMNRIFWLCFIIIQMIFILICFNDDWLMSLVKFILNPTDTTETMRSYYSLSSTVLEEEQGTTLSSLVDLSLGQYNAYFETFKTSAG